MTIILCMALSISRPKEIDLGRVVDCIAQVENNPEYWDGGVLGWTEAAWKEDTNFPYSYSKDYYYARWVGIWRLQKYCERLKLKHQAVTVEVLANYWRGIGIEPSYGQRVSNLYYDTKN